MNNKIKNAAIVAGVLFAASLGWSAISYVDSYSKSIEPSSFRSFSVSAEGEAVGVPDIAEFTFTVITEGGHDLGALQKDNSDKVNAAIAYVKEQGVDSKDIKTVNYNISPRYEYRNCESGSVVCTPPSIVGYTVRSSVKVKVRETGKAGGILASIVSKGANEVSGLSFVIDNPETVTSEARADAIKKAKTKAEEIAKQSGVRIGRLLSINEGNYYPVYRDSYKSVMTEAAGVSATTPSIEIGSEDIKVQVTLVYEIK